jgi:hypothetical protein
MGKATNKRGISDVGMRSNQEKKKINAKAIKHKSRQVAPMMFKGLNLHGASKQPTHI